MEELPVWLNYLNKNDGTQYERSSQQNTQVQRAQLRRAKQQAQKDREQQKAKLRRAKDLWQKQRQGLNTQLDRVNRANLEQLDRVKQKLRQEQLESEKTREELAADRETWSTTQSDLKGELEKYKKLLRDFPDEQQSNKKRILTLTQALQRKKDCDPAQVNQLKQKIGLYPEERNALLAELKSYKKLLRDFPAEEDANRQRIAALTADVERYKNMVLSASSDPQIEKLGTALRLEKQQRQRALRAKDQQIQTVRKNTVAEYAQKIQGLKAQTDKIRQTLETKVNQLTQTGSTVDRLTQQSAKKTETLAQAQTKIEGLTKQRQQKSKTLTEVQEQLKKNRALIAAYNPQQAVRNAQELRKLKGQKGEK
jgi:chromosome segregation ATPase